ncbi:MAG: efflux RND transporter permease subunit [Desulfovibrionaceae bacterium]
MLKTFITKPILSSVISIIIVIAGVLAGQQLPVELYPDILPPSVSVSAMYPGASPEIMSSLVAAPLEEQINGVDDMIYMQSVTSNGFLTINVFFEVGADPDMATVNVNNRIQGVLSSLPQEVQQQGVTVRKKSGFILMIPALVSTSPVYDSLYLNNYANINIINNIRRISGVGDAVIFGAKLYSMRIWLDPAKMAVFNMSSKEVIAAVQAQNKRNPIGTIGASPNDKLIEVTYSVVDQNPPSNVQDFDNIIIRTQDNGNILRLKDVARVELGGESYDFYAKLDGQEAVPMGIFLAPGANATATAAAVIKEMDALAKHFPEGIEYKLAYDTTVFITVSTEEVIFTFITALILVVLIMYLFMQDIRATIIPCLAIPISIIGTFAGLYVFGFSLNAFTLFALVLAIGIVVDDAIIVIENVERIMSTERLGPIPATMKAMEEITGAVIGSTLVLCAVFVPIGFMGGLAGVMYKQFAITISISVCISSLVALTLTPSMCALLLKPRDHTKKHFLDFFNVFMDKVTEKFSSAVKFLLGRMVLGFLVMLVLIGSTIFGFKILPRAFAPEEDQGYIFSVLIFPEGSSIRRSLKTEETFRALAKQDDNVKNVFSMMGFDFFTGALRENYSVEFVTLKDWSVRKKAEQSAQAIVARLAGITYMAIPEAITIVLNPPPIPGLSNTGGFQLYVQNLSGAPIAELEQVAKKLAQDISKSPKIAPGVRSLLSANTPQINLAVNKEKALTLGVAVEDVYLAMQTTIGTFYVNQFTLFDRPFKVYMQAESEFRDLKDSFEKIYVVSKESGKPVPISALVTLENTTGVSVLERFNTYTAASIMGSPAADASSMEAIDAVEEIARETLPEGYSIAWFSSAYQEKESQSGTGFVLLLSAVFVILILAALYESITLPMAVMLTVPIGILGALSATFARGLTNDLYFQIAIVTLIGLTAKTAILIVEFAVQLHKAGDTITEAAIKASQLRLRPVLMTMASFILGSMPLVISSGAGAAARHSLGTAIVGGMVLYTLIGIVFVPYFYKVVMVLTEKISGTKKHTIRNDQTT